jgi:hypothetical protein
MVTVILTMRPKNALSAKFLLLYFRPVIIMGAHDWALFTVHTSNT